jgi:hypothetical protein
VYPPPWSETPATSFLLTRELTLDASGAADFVMQAERDPVAGGARLVSANHRSCTAGTEPSDVFVAYHTASSGRTESVACDQGRSEVSGGPGPVEASTPHSLEQE